MKYFFIILACLMIFVSNWPGQHWGLTSMLQFDAIIILVLVGRK